mmetsp:Transcript_26792/g.42863  ORF Transcript_26792/g.42863 Transcript_26792/m.42863 type:complete len:167 (+) Transcript_26792:61-561(+)
MCSTQTCQDVMLSEFINSKVEKDSSHVDSCNASTASDCSDESLREFDLDDFVEWQAIAEWVEDDLDEYIGDWVEQDLEEYCSYISEPHPSGKRVRFSQDISYVEPEDYIFEIVAHLRAERKAKKVYDKQCHEYAEQWKVYMEYWQKAGISALKPISTSTTEGNAEQ